ncbi:hypothetical protein DSL72_004418 [Monilinia vaccinii-corymbosi]|uniref:Uncharacterized protein n=1 Tax=Monilinia vaccinii-corymbosi TaxID=61207 RepID=A0A8A3P0G2_9HELO|nr:hypothetical protein DSL72_004418 [Monilinia vaccinii-corymbosi]
MPKILTQLLEKFWKIWKFLFMSIKRRISNMNDLRSELGLDVEDSSHKTSRSAAGSSPNPVSSPVPEIMEGFGFPSTLQTSDDTSFVDRTFSSSSPSSPLSSAPTDIVNMDIDSADEDTVTVGEFNPTSSPFLQDSISIFCTIKFNDLYYLDFQTPFTHPDQFFDLTQDPERWVYLCAQSPHNEHESTPDRYIKHCLSLMWNQTGNCRDIIAVLLFAWFHNDKKNPFHFWGRVRRHALDMMDFENALGEPISYLGRIELPGGLSRACWNHALQECLENEGMWGPSALFMLDRENGFRWLKVSAEEEENLMNGCSFAENWVIGLPRNEYYW